MDKYPVLENGTAAGELTVWPDRLYTVFHVSCPPREGLWRAWAVGETGTLRIGVLEPENGVLCIRRRFSRELTAPAGPLLRGELRPLGEEREPWEPLRADSFQTPYLQRCLRESAGALMCRSGDRRLVALPRDDTVPFPLEAMFCFARPRRLRGRDWWVFAFDEAEWPAF